MGLDITESEQSLVALQESEERLRQQAARLADAVNFAANSNSTDSNRKDVIPGAVGSRNSARN